MCVAQAIRQGTRLGLQLQLAWALLLLLGALQARAYLAQVLEPQAYVSQAAMGMVPILAGALLLASLSWQPWKLEPPLQKVGSPAIKYCVEAVASSFQSRRFYLRAC